MASIRLMPLAVDAAVGAADGYLSVNDTKNGRADAWGRPLPNKGYQNLYGIWAEVGALGGGILLGMQRFNSDIADSLVQSGAALLGRRLGVHLGLSGIPTGTTGIAPTTTPMFRAPMQLPAGGAGMRAQGQFISNRQKPRILS
jgi:hypothetical protein